MIFDADTFRAHILLEMLSTSKCTLSVANRRLLSGYSLRPNPWQMEKLTDIGSRNIFTEEHDLMRESTRKFYASVTTGQGWQIIIEEK